MSIGKKIGHKAQAAKGAAKKFVLDPHGMLGAAA